MNHYQTSTAQTVMAHRNKKPSFWAFLAGCAGLSVLGLLVLAGVGYFIYRNQLPVQSVVYIREPVDNAVLYAGDPVLIRALARDDKKVQQVELWVDDQLIDVQTSQLADGSNPFPILTYWYPKQSGTYTISARALNPKGKQAVSQMTVTVLAREDQDGDMVPDQLDACPDLAGDDSAQGCPDRDADGTADEIDACPDQAALSADGCPVPDEADLDGDGVGNEQDQCPDLAGPAGAQGCPDRDGDGIQDAEDACPDQVGLSDGCPVLDDQDADGIPDNEDRCPTAWGTADLAGCNDSDADGIIDEEDACPTTAGSADNNGCPDLGGPMLPPPPDPNDDPPEEGSGIGDGVFKGALIPMELQGSELYVRNTYDTFWCYLRLDNGGPIRFDFTAIDRQFWDIESALSGDNSINTIHDEDLPFLIDLDCWGQNSGGEAEQVATLHLSHPGPDWDGRTLYAATPANDFSILYHICTPSCHESSLQSPILHPITTGPIGEGPYEVRWQWNGDESQIDGFHLSQVREYDRLSLTDITDTSARSLNMEDYIPACNETSTFVLLAYKTDPDGHRIYSLPSNPQTWTRSRCNYLAQITFRSLTIPNQPSDQGESNSVGPVSGMFYAYSGSDLYSLRFSGTWHSAAGYRADGLHLRQGVIGVIPMFEWINRQIDSCLGNGCHSNSFYAPNRDYLTVGFSEGETITFGSLLTDYDTGPNPNDTLIGTSITIDPHDIPAGTFTDYWLEGDTVNVHVVVTILDS